jgi:hypothetical protein
LCAAIVLQKDYQARGGNVKRAMAIGLVVVVLIVAVALPVFADDPLPIYYVNESNKGGCQDGSLQCPYESVKKAIQAGKAEICINNEFEVHLWDADKREYVPDQVVAGTRPIPGAGLPLSRAAVILMIALLGAVFVLIALLMRRTELR